MSICLQVILFLSFYQVINDLLDPTGQNLRIREDSQVSILFSFSHTWLHMYIKQEHLLVCMISLFSL